MDRLSVLSLMVALLAASPGAVRAESVEGGNGSAAIAETALGAPEAAPATEAAEIVTVSSIADLRAAVPDEELVDGQQVHLLGYYKADDHGSGRFSWDSDSTDDDNGGSVIRPDDWSGPGRWLRLDDGFLTPQMFGAGASHDGVENTLRTQQALYALQSRGGGELRFPPVSLPFTAIPDAERSDLPPGYDPDWENHGAPKCLILYQVEGITLSGFPGAVIDRSGDTDVKARHSRYGATVYISDSENITVRGIKFIGVQDDAEILSGGNDVSSGSTVVVNNGSSGITMEQLEVIDGKALCHLGWNRSPDFNDIHAKLAPVTDIRIRDVTVTNCQYKIIFFDCEDVIVDGLKGDYSIRESGHRGVTRRGLYFHSCRDVTVRNVTLAGVFKVGLFFRGYKPLRDISVENVIIRDPLPEAELLELRPGVGYSEAWEGVGMQLRCNGSERIRIKDFVIENYISGVRFTDEDLRDVTFRNGRIRALRFGMRTQSFDDDSNGPIRGMRWENVHLEVSENLKITDGKVDSGLSIQSGHSEKCEISFVNCIVRSQNRNARIFDCRGEIVNCTFGQLPGYTDAEARDFDLHLYNSAYVLNDNIYETQHAPNHGEDSPASGLGRDSESRVR